MAIDTFGSGVAAATFRTRPLGFDKDEVRACLQNLASDYEEAQRQIDRLTARLRAFEDVQEQSPARSTTAVQVERVLASAHKIAEDVKVEAEAAAKKILSDAQGEAARLRTQAERDASDLTSNAATRLNELNVEIERTMERREVVNAQLYRMAEQLEEVSRAIRSTTAAPAMSASETTTRLKPQIVARA
jgi:cell division septum initiation protein DivIVA